MQSVNRLPPLKSPTNMTTFDVDGMAKKKIIVKDPNRRTKSLVKQRPPQNQQANMSFSFPPKQVGNKFNKAQF